MYHLETYVQEGFLFNVILTGNRFLTEESNYFNIQPSIFFENLSRVLQLETGTS